MVHNQQSTEPGAPPAGSVGANSAGVEGPTWYPVLLEMLWDLPRLIAPVPDRPSSSRMEMAAVWPISGKDSQEAAFQKKLLNSCYNHGGPSQPTPMTHNFENGPCGVLKGVAIQFQDLPLM